MTPVQCKDARTLLGMTRDRLAAASDVPLAVIQIYENKGYLPRCPGKETRQDRLRAIRTALETAGAEFTGGDPPGVRLRSHKET